MLKDEYLNDKIKIKKYLGLSALTIASGIVLSTLPTFTIEGIKNIDIKGTIEYLKLVRENISLSDLDFANFNINSLNPVTLILFGTVANAFLISAYKLNEKAKAKLYALWPNEKEKIAKQKIKDYKKLKKTIQIIAKTNRDIQKEYIPVIDTSTGETKYFEKRIEPLNESKRASKELSKIDNLDEKLLLLDNFDDISLLNEYLTVHLEDEIVKKLRRKNQPLQKDCN